MFCQSFFPGCAVICPYSLEKKKKKLYDTSTEKSTEKSTKSENGYDSQASGRKIKHQEIF